MQTSRGKGQVKYWRAPKPRPRMHRRRRRKCKKQVLDKTMSQATIVPASLTEAHVAIQVLQAALRAALLREEKTKQQFCTQVAKTSAMVPQQPGDAGLQQNDVAESGFTGVTRNKSCWSAYTERQQGVRQHLGTFSTPMEAARARRDYLNNVAAAAMEQLPKVRAEKIKNHVAKMRECRRKYVELYGQPGWAQEFWYQWGRPHSAPRLYDILSTHVDQNNVKLRAMAGFKQNYRQFKWSAHVAAVHTPQWNLTLPFAPTFEWITMPMGILSICYLISLLACGP